MRALICATRGELPPDSHDVAKRLEQLGIEEITLLVKQDASRVRALFEESIPGALEVHYRAVTRVDPLLDFLDEVEDQLLLVGRLEHPSPLDRRELRQGTWFYDSTGEWSGWALLASTLLKGGGPLSRLPERIKGDDQIISLCAAQ